MMLTLQDLLRTRTTQPSLNKAMYFNGINSYVEGAISFSWGGVGYEASFEALIAIEPRDIPSTYTWGYGHSGVNTLYDHWQGGWLGVGYAGSAGSIATDVKPVLYYWNFPVWVNVSLAFRTWHHMVGTFKPLDKDVVRFELYLNGSRVYANNITWSGIGSATGVSSVFRFGLDNAWRGLRFKGYIAVARIYRKVLSGSEVTHNMRFINNPVRDKLVLWIDARACDASKCYDLSGNNYYGNLYNVTIISFSNPIGVGGSL